MDAMIDKEIQNLIDDNRGDKQRLEFIRNYLQEEKIPYNSDLKFLVNLLEKYSMVENVTGRLDYLHPKKKQFPNIEIYENQKYCTICEKMVCAERDFSKTALVILLVIGIIPGLIYFAVKNKTCPICKNTQWGVSPKDHL